MSPLGEDQKRQTKQSLTENILIAHEVAAYLRLTETTICKIMKKTLGTLVAAMLSFFIVTFVFADKTAAGKIGRDGRFIAYEDGMVMDTRAKLMWAEKDNGSDINWQGAKSYCENYRGGGYTDWRMPTQDELARLYDTAKTYKSDCGYDVHLTGLIRLTRTAPWASETHGSYASLFYFGNGSRGWYLQSYGNISRALPVRSGK